MLLFKGHPESVGKTKRVYKAIPMDTKQKIIEEVRHGMHGYKGYQMRGKEITGLFMDAVHIEAMLTLMNYKRILVLTSYEDSKYSSLTDGSETNCIITGLLCMLFASQSGAKFILDQLSDLIHGWIDAFFHQT